SVDPPPRGSRYRGGAGSAHGDQELWADVRAQPPAGLPQDRFARRGAVVVDSVVVVSALAATAAYLLGSIPTGPLLAQARGVDLRAVGSGNIGAANATRALGKALGVVTFLGDALKGFAPTYAAVYLQFPTEAVAIVGFAAFFGHLFPLYLRFRGGKGVATAAGIFFAMAPQAAAIAL